MRLSLRERPGSCAACGGAHPFDKLTICIACFQRPETAPVRGCARCGKGSCAGGCGFLQAFLSVTALVAYQPPFPRLVGLAKGAGFACAQRVYRDMFLVRVARALEREIRASSIAIVVLSPVRWIRLADLRWHTHAVMLDAARLARERCARAGHVVDVRWGIAARLFPQARTPSATRRLRAARLEPKTRSAEKPSPLGIREAVLVVDDVLTSGETASRIAARLAAEGPLGSRRLHFLCVFRAPVPESSDDLVIPCSPPRRPPSPPRRGETGG